jgi:hypothetical protein
METLRRSKFQLATDHVCRSGTSEMSGGSDTQTSSAKRGKQNERAESVCVPSGSSQHCHAWARIYIYTRTAPKETKTEEE